MKYFENLPKTTFDTSIGSFTISDFFTYIDVSKSKFNPSPLDVDSKTTLLEASYTVYNDVNTFWAFLISNNSINPFTLTSTNTSLFVKENQPKTSLEFVQSITGATSYVFPVGSIITPYVANTGGSYSYTSVGNFNIDGPFSLIESVSYHNQTMIIKDQRGATYSFILQNGNTGSEMVILSPTGGGEYEIFKQYYPAKTKSAIFETTKIELSEEKYIEEVAPATKESSKIKSPSSQSALLPTANGTDIVALDVVEFESSEIKAYTTEEIGRLKGLFVTAKYI